MKLENKIKKIVLMQPNYAWMMKRTWRYPPYTLCLLKAVIGDRAETVVFDPNFMNLSEEDVSYVLKKIKPDLVGVTSCSSEYLNVSKLLTSIIGKTLPKTIIVSGGVIPTVMLEESMKDKNVDYWMTGECDVSLPMLIDELQREKPELSKIRGLAYWQDGKIVKNENVFLDNLDDISFPDYSNIIGSRDMSKISIHDYGNVIFKYAPVLLSKKHPFAITITSRGCPYKCIFCAARTVSGQKVRFRSAKNVLAEIDLLYSQGIREVIFLDDHFLANRKRVLDIMNGIIERKYDMVWRCGNVTAWLLDREILEVMYKSGCDFLLVSPESGNQYVLDNIVKKPLKLDKLPGILDMARSIGFSVMANFIFGFPGETWDQIRDTIKYAERLNVDMVNFHIATPLPKTELMEMCLRDKLLPGDYSSNISKYSGYGSGLITTKEFMPLELEVLRSFEWDRINFSSDERKRAVMKLNGITEEDLENWRMNTRRNLGVNSLVNNIMSVSNEAKA